MSKAIWCYRCGKEMEYGQEHCSVRRAFGILHFCSKACFERWIPISVPQFITKAARQRPYDRGIGGYDSGEGGYLIQPVREEQANAD